MFNDQERHLERSILVLFDSDDNRNLNIPFSKFVEKKRIEKFVLKMYEVYR